MSGFLRDVSTRTWLILVPTLLFGTATCIASSFLPARYQSESTIQVVPPRMAEGYVRSTVGTKIEERLPGIMQQILSRTKLESIIQDFGLYDGERKTALMENIVQEMRGDISVRVIKGDAFRVSYISEDPKTAMKVTERLASLFIEQNLRDRANLAEGANQFLDARVEDVRDRILACEKKLEQAKAENGGRPPSRALTIEYEVLQETYKTLLTKNEESRVASNLEQRQISEQFKVIDPARLPEQPIGPNRVYIDIVGTLVGLGVGVVLVGLSFVRGVRQARPVSTGV